MTIAEIKGHPSIDAHRTGRAPKKITLCANCESVKSILFLTGDRWFCTKCRNEGKAQPTQISMFNPHRPKGAY